MKRMIRAVTAMLASLFIASSLVAQTQEELTRANEKLRDALKEGDSVVALDEARDALKEVLPLVEKATGKTFKQAPEIKLIDREQTAQALEQQITAQIAAQAAAQGVQLPQDQLKGLAKNQAEAQAKLLLSRYDKASNSILYNPRNYIPLARIAKLDEKEALPLFRLTLIFTLCQAIYQQETDPKKILDGIKGQEAFSALMQGTDGAMIYFADQAATEAKIEEKIRQAGFQLLYGTLLFDDPVLKETNEAAKGRFDFVYTGPMKFVLGIAKSGGSAKVWEFLNTPPKKFSTFYHPDQYGAEKFLDFAKAFDGVEKVLSPDQEWEKAVASPSLLSQRDTLAARGAGQKETDEAFRKVREIGSVTARIKGQPKGFFISVIACDDAKTAGAVFDACEKVVKKMAETNKGKISSSKPGDIQAEQAMKHLSEASQNGQTVKTSTYRVQKGEYVFEISESNLDADDKKVAEILKTIVSRLASPGEGGAGKTEAEKSPATRTAEAKSEKTQTEEEKTEATKSEKSAKTDKTEKTAKSAKTDKTTK